MLTASHNLPKLERATPASKFKTEIQTLERSLCESFDQYKLPIKILPYIQRYNDRLKSGASTLFDSLEMINTEFADLHNSLFQQPMWGDFAIGDPIFQGLQLILFWYHLVAIEAYVSDALYKQDKKKAENSSNDTSIWYSKNNLLKQKVSEFNLKVKQLENFEYSRSLIDITTYNCDDLNFIFAFLMTEEHKLTTIYDDSPEMVPILREGSNLLLSIQEHHTEVNHAIAKFKDILQKKQLERLKIYDFELNIDAHLIKQFHDLPVAKAYEMLQNTGKADHIMRIDMITQFDTALQKFHNKMHLLKSRNSGRHQLFMDTVLKLLNTSHQNLILRLNIPSLENEYKQQIALMTNAKEIEGIEKAYKAKAREFLLQALLDENTAKAWRAEVNHNLETQVNAYAQSISPGVLPTDIMSLRIHEIRAAKLNETWEQTIHLVFQHKLNKLKIEFYTMQGLINDEAFEKVGKLRHQLSGIMEFVLNDVIHKLNISPERIRFLENILFKVCKKVSQDEIFKHMDIYLAECIKQRTQVVMQPPIVETVKPATIVEKPTENTAPPAPQPVTISTTPLTQKQPSPPEPKKIPWKESLYFALFICVVIGLAMTGWGLVVGAASVLAALGGWGGICGILAGTFVFAGTSHYASQLFCKSSHTQPGSIVSTTSEISTINQQPKNTSYNSIHKLTPRVTAIKQDVIENTNQKALFKQPVSDHDKMQAKGEMVNTARSLFVI